jgi:hypothetical protein
MAEHPNQKPIHELWSAISPTDLGLKVGYWTGKQDDPLVFKPILGWISVVANEMPSSGPPKNDFYPVVLSDNMYPTVATVLQSYCGVFLNRMSEAEAKEAAKKWMESGATPQANVRGTGLA